MAETSDPENTVKMELKDGVVTIALRPDLAPNHVERIKTLTRQGFYNGVVFHRVIEGFMAQTGDPTGTGMGGSDLPDLKAEFSEPSQARHLRGTCSMARTQNPNSANSQFFICLADVPHLDGQYTIWGQVVDGMDAVDGIKVGPSARNGKVDDPDSILKMWVAADE
ncbi:peptidylprolyl isomerase [Roseospira marina]|uniref:Peptidyl-prolyl cis-trans isomerase n=1 Tax=Roseospira marina TaxID=140057 RepID=A0A5M6I8P0_9PROT|nr:peptidylprolyl isomerase [Roseospira marina]KAA5604606.1 peptidylprolyl isomerase [Roseospira marina]MBB4315358.1 peptidylprolyl isomerase [Roseospira marina]MBB5088357.1 peptidylprolyl isomerase [Roseospira marina]